MRKLILSLICIVLFLMDNTLMPFLEIFKGFPSLLFIFAICSSFLYDYIDAIYIGIFSGILQDIFFSSAFGVNPLLNLIFCVVANYIGEKINENSIVIPVISFVPINIAKSVFIYLIFLAMGKVVHINDVLLNTIYGTILFIIVYRLSLRLYKFKYMQEGWTFRE